MSWQTEKLAEQAEADALFTMGGAEWRETYEDSLEPQKISPCGRSGREDDKTLVLEPNPAKKGQI